MALTHQQRTAIEVTERLGSVLSLIGTAFIIGTFLYDKAFHKPINRLVFYASWGNIMANVGTLISRSGIDLGQERPLCQFQAFLIQMFIPADALWTLAMAFNVYLTFFRKYNAQQLRSLEWKYMIFCYGCPFLPAFAYFFVQSSSRGKVYGSATLWCWVTSEWDFLRVATFYGPVWVVITITFGIYIWAGKEIFAKRQQLRDFSSAANDAVFPVIQNPFISPFVSVKTTEIRITTELVDVASQRNSSTNSLTLNENGRIVSSQNFNPYSVTIGAGSTLGGAPPGSPHFSRSSNSMKLGAERSAKQRAAAMEANKAAFSYCKCALLFFLSLLITWVPSSINRVYSLVYPDSICFPLLYIAGFVLPLQGLWNAVIYTATSLPACRALGSQLKEYWIPERKAKPSSSFPFLRTKSPNRSIGSSEDGLKISFPYAGLQETP